MQKPLLVISERLTVTKSVFPDWNHRPYHSSGNVQPETRREGVYREGVALQPPAGDGRYTRSVGKFPDFNLRTRRRFRAGNAKQSKAAATTIFFSWIAGEQLAGLYASGLPFSDNVAERKRNETIVTAVSRSLFLSLPRKRKMSSPRRIIFSFPARSAGDCTS